MTGGSVFARQMLAKKKAFLGAASLYSISYDRTKKIIDALPRRPFNMPILHRNDTAVALEILDLQAVLMPRARQRRKEISKARRAAFKTAHPDVLTGSPEFTSNRGGLERCLEEAIHLRGYIETATLALTLPAEAACGSWLIMDMIKSSCLMLVCIFNTHAGMSSLPSTWKLAAMTINMIAHGLTAFSVLPLMPTEEEKRPSRAGGLSRHD